MPRPWYSRVWRWITIGPVIHCACGNSKFRARWGSPAAAYDCCPDCLMKKTF